MTPWVFSANVPSLQAVVCEVAARAGEVDAVADSPATARTAVTTALRLFILGVPAQHGTG
jgi:hypothetical protein